MVILFHKTLDKLIVIEYNKAEVLKNYCLETGKDLVVEKLNFNKVKDKLISKRGKKYNEMLSTLAYSKFDKIITSKCVKNRIFLNKVNPAWTSWIGKRKILSKNEIKHTLWSLLCYCS